MNSSLQRILFVAVVLLFQPSLADMPTQAEPVVVAYSEFRPYSFTDEDGKPRGFSVDLIRGLGDAAGLEIEFRRAINPASVLEMLASGEADLTTLLALTDTRLERGLPTTSVGQFELRAFALRAQELTGMGGLTGRTVGVVKGSFGLDGARQIPFAQIVEFANTDAMILPLLTGEVAAVISTEESFLSRLREIGAADQVAAVSPPLISSPYGFIVAPDRPDVQLALDAAIGQALVGPDIELLRERWFGRDARLTDHHLFWPAVLAAVSILAALIVLMRRVRYFRARAEGLKRSGEANALLLEALDAVNGAVVIYDREKRALHRNRAFDINFPALIPDVEAGARMRSLIGRSYDDGTMRKQDETFDREAFLDGVIAAVDRGTSNARTVHTRDGRTFEARDFKLGADYHASIRVDVTARHQQEETIRAQAKKLEAANERLQTFATLAAHDLRAPLKRIEALMGFVAEDIADLGAPVSSEVAGHIGNAKDQATRMAKLVEDLLIYFSADAASDPPTLVTPRKEIDEAIALVDRPEGFEVAVEADVPAMRVHPTAFQGVLRNLVSNAIKHHDRSEGRVHVKAETGPKAVTFTVTDDGAGIPTAYRAQIFEPFKRLSEATQGNGLGLSYIKKTVEGWGGHVSVAPAEPRGSVFSFTVPVPEGDRGRMH